MSLKNLKKQLESLIENLQDVVLEDSFEPSSVINEILNLVHEHKIFQVEFLKTDKLCFELKQLKTILLADAEFFYQSDPAAKSLQEVLISYPGFLALKVHRIAHVLNQHQLPIIPRFFAEWAHAKTGIDIHPGASIGSPLFIDHGTGIVIGETAEIGKNVKIYQGVTLGALAVNKSDCKVKRHPSIKDNVVLYAGCVILGGNTVVGNNSIIGGNVWLTKSVLPYSVVQHVPEIVISDHKALNSVIDFSI